MKYLAYSIIFIIGNILALLLGAFVTGRTAKTYETLSPNDAIHIAEKQQSVSKLSELYRPQMYLKADTPSPPIMWIWYEVVETETTYDIVYYFHWENEVNPYQTINTFYSIFRAAYFGYPLYDIEYFQVSVNKKNGRIDRFKLETSEFHEFNQKSVEHIIADVQRVSEEGNVFFEKQTRKNGELVKKGNREVLFDGQQVLAGSMTWNHMTCLLDNQNQSIYSKRVDEKANLKYLDDKAYSQYKFARKSQGDYITREKTVWSILTVLVIVLLMNILMFKMQKNIFNPKPLLK